MKNILKTFLYTIGAFLASAALAHAAILFVQQGGTGVGTITGLVKGNGTSPFTVATAGTDYQLPYWQRNSTTLSPVTSGDSIGLGTTAATNTLTLGSTATGIAAYNTSDQTVNYERVVSFWAGGTFNISSQNGGTGAPRDISINTNSLNDGLTIRGNGRGSSFTSNSGSAIAGGFFNSTGTFNGASTSQIVSGIAPTIAQTGTSGYTAFLVDPFEQSVGSGSKLLIDAGTNTAANGSGTHTSLFQVNNAGQLIVFGRIGVGAGIIGAAPSAKFQIGNDSYSTSNVFSTSGFAFRSDASTYNSAATAGSPATVGVNTFGIPTLTGTNAQAIANAATLYVDGAPTAGTNVTIANPWAIFVGNNAQSFMGGNVVSNGRFTANNTSSVAALFGAGTGTFSTSAAYNISGFGIQIPAMTFLSNATAGSPALVGINTLGIPTLTAANAQSITTAATFYIDGAPTASTNVTVTNPLALYVNAGLSGFNGGITTSISALGGGANFFSAGGSNATASGNVALQFAGSSSVTYRSGFFGASATAIGVGANYANMLVASAPIATGATGTNAWVVNQAINAVGVITNGGGGVPTNTASLYIDGASATGTNNYALYVNSGNTFLGGTTFGVGGMQTSTGFSSSNFASTGGTAASGQFTNSALLFGGNTGIQTRTLFNGSSSGTVVANGGYANVVVGQAPVTTAASGTHPFFANFVVNPLGTVTSGGAAITNTASLYIGGASTAGANNFAAYVASGLTKLSGLIHSFGQKSANYPLTSNDEIIEDTTGTTTETLPTAVGVAGETFTIKTTAVTGIVTVATTSSQTIDGAATYLLSTQYKYVTVVSNGANWDIIANN